MPLPWAINLDLGWRSVDDATVRDEELCFLYDPRQLCEIGVATRETTLWTISGGVGRRLELTPRLAVIPAAAVTLGTLKQQAHGSTRFPPFTHTPGSSQLGGVGILEVAIRPVPSVPFELSFAGASQWVSFNGCAPGVDLYAPFCGVAQFWELQFGAAFVR